MHEDGFKVEYMCPKFEFNALQKFYKQLCSLYPEPFTNFSHDNLSRNNTVGGMVGLLTLNLHSPVPVRFEYG